MWRYLHARTVVRLLARVQPVVRDHSAAAALFLRRFIESQASVSVLQVGSYDGTSNDPVHDLVRGYPQVRAVLLEPQPGPFALLQTLWRDTPRVTPLRCALADAPGERTLYVIADAHKHRHPFPDQVASFLKSQVEFAFSRYVWRPPADAITSLAVPTSDWRTLVQTYGPFDLVAIDAEVYDAEILHQIDLSTWPPAVILYEHRCLTRDMRRRCERLLVSHGYLVSQVNNADSLASRVGPPGF